MRRAHRAWWIAAAAIAFSFVLPARSFADAPGLVVVIESPVPFNARALRRELGVALDVRVVSMLDPEARDASGTLVVGIVEGGRARIRYRMRGGAEQEEMAPAPRRGRRSPAWVATVAIELIRRTHETAWSAETTRDVIDPYQGMPPRRSVAIGDMPVEVVDPFGRGSGPLFAVRQSGEVIDPWRRNSAEPMADPWRPSGSALSAPDPTQ